jgi:DNA repair protein RecO (recombination protein O)
MIHKTECIVLKSFPFMETSVISTLYTRDSGKIAVKALGARRLNSKLGAALDPPSHSSVIISSKEGRELQILREASVVQSFEDLKQGVKRLAHASIVLDILYHFNPTGAVDEGLFDLSLAALEALNGCESEAFPCSMAFLLKAMKILGYGPELYSCVVCKRSIDLSGFSTSRGGVVCDRCRARGTGMRVSENLTQGLRDLRSATFSDISGLGLSSQIQQDIGDLLKRFLSHHAEKELKTLNFLEKLP